jgi:hypothetical protein
MKIKEGNNLIFTWLLLLYDFIVIKDNFQIFIVFNYLIYNVIYKIKFLFHKLYIIIKQSFKIYWIIFNVLKPVLNFKDKLIFKLVICFSYPKNEN